MLDEGYPFIFNKGSVSGNFPAFSQELHSEMWNPRVDGVTQHKDLYGPHQVDNFVPDIGRAGQDSKPVTVVLFEQTMKNTKRDFNLLWKLLPNKSGATTTKANETQVSFFYGGP